MTRTLIVAALMATRVSVFAQTSSTQPPTSVAIQSMTVGKHFTCGLDGSGQAFCWGANYHGQLGVSPDSAPASCELASAGRTGCALLPVAVSTPVRFTQLAAGESHVCGVSTEQGVWCWGFNGERQLGGAEDSAQCKAQQGAAAPGEGKFAEGPCAYVPRQVTLEALVLDVASGDKFTCAMSDQGTIACWGANLTDGPRVIPRVYGFVDLSAGGTQLCARSREGQVSCWSVSDGSIGYAEGKGLETFMFTTHATSAHSCGIEGSGDAYCWGPGSLGELGGISRPAQGTIEPGPQPVIGGVKFREIAVARGSTCALDKEGRMHCWGATEFAPRASSCESGTGQVACALRPQPAMRGRTFRTIYIGNDHSCGMDAAGVAVCWGANSAGQLGNGNMKFASTAQVVGRVPTAWDVWKDRIGAAVSFAISRGTVAAIVLLVLLGFRREQIAKRPRSRMITTWLVSGAIAAVLAGAAFVAGGAGLSILLWLLAPQPLLVAIGLTIYWYAKRDVRRAKVPVPAKRPVRPVTPGPGPTVKK